MAATLASAGSTKIKPESEKPGALWDPVPITMPTYVSKPLAPRTVRTIDLSGPGVTSSARHQLPVTADAPLEESRPKADDGDAQQAASA